MLLSASDAHRAYRRHFVLIQPYLNRVLGNCNRHLPPRRDTGPKIEAGYGDDTAGPGGWDGLFRLRYSTGANSGGAIRRGANFPVDWCFGVSGGITEDWSRVA
jgi:hypothetical protein